MQTIRNTTGGPSQGGDFFDRVPEQDRAWRHLETNSLLLLGPRRTGKTSLLRRLQDQAEQHAFQAIFEDVSDVHSEQQFAERLHERILAAPGGQTTLRRLIHSAPVRSARRILPNKLSGSGYGVSAEFHFEAEQQDSWTGSDDLIKALGRLPGRWLVILDELPIFVTTLLQLDPEGTRARRFLEWFRRLRQGWEGAEHLRWILAGSIGLDMIAAQRNLGDTINDLRPFEVGPFSPEVADGFLALLAGSYGLDFSPEARSLAVKRLEWTSPYFLQVLFSSIRDYCEDRGETSIQEEYIDIAFESLLQPAHRSYFDYWRQRLYKQLDRPRALWAKQLLAKVARHESGLTWEALFQLSSPNLPSEEREDSLSWLLRMLEMDGYLIKVNAAYRFRSPLLRDFWRRANNA